MQLKYKAEQKTKGYNYI